jgi:hypothetical protein
LLHSQRIERTLARDPLGSAESHDVGLIELDDVSRRYEVGGAYRRSKAR